MNAFADNALMEKVKDGELSCMGLLFERHHQRIYNYFLRLAGKREVSEDLAQEVFLRVLKYRRSYRPGAPFEYWLFSVARNVGRDYFNRVPPETPMEQSPEAAAEDDPFEGLAREQSLDALRKAFGCLEWDKREALILSRFENMKYDEIARLTGASVGAVKVRVHRALKELRGWVTQILREKAS